MCGMTSGVLVVKYEIPVDNQIGQMVILELRKESELVMSV